ncbi:MAG: hypothetical protein LAN71_04500 [Acidobacteriia bacterium]|nr:hypothetical protein [Terriglobia bacterium]
MAEIKAEYEQLKAGLQACYSDIEFKEKTEGSADWDNERWTLSGHNASVMLILTATDGFHQVQFLPEEKKKTPVQLSLAITTRP